MKKKNLRSLRLNKKSISDLSDVKAIGGRDPNSATEEKNSQHHSELESLLVSSVRYDPNSLQDSGDR